MADNVTTGTNYSTPPRDTVIATTQKTDSSQVQHVRLDDGTTPATITTDGQLNVNIGTSDNKVSVTNGAVEVVQTYNNVQSVPDLLLQILGQLKVMNYHLALVTGEHIEDETEVR